MTPPELQPGKTWPQWILSRLVPLFWRMQEPALFLQTRGIRFDPSNESRDNCTQTSGSLQRL
jgi:hypothetical protein